LSADFHSGLYGCTRCRPRGGRRVTSNDKIADFDGDGKDDLVQLMDNGQARVLLSNADGFIPYTVWGRGTGVGDNTGNDIFAFNANFGKDIITDFEAGPGASDVIQFDHTLFADFNAVLAHTADDGHGNTVITYDQNNSIILEHVLKANFAANDFLFV